MKKHSISKENKLAYQSLVILDEMINNKQTFTVINQDDDFKDLEPILVYMLSKELIQIEGDTLYIPTFKGREMLVKYFNKYFDYLRVFDIFCAVDLDTGEFAFTEYFETSEEVWESLLAEDRWSDVRIAVAEFKKMDPVELVFISFMNEKRFDLETEGWQFDLTSDLIWDEILEICDTAIHTEQFTEEVMTNIITSGSEMMWDILKQEKELEELDNVGDEYEDDEEDGRVTYVEVVEEIEIDIDYYGYYRDDPYYLGPCWYEPWYY